MMVDEQRKENTYGALNNRMTVENERLGRRNKEFFFIPGEAKMTFIPGMFYTYPTLRLTLKVDEIDTRNFQHLRRITSRG